MEHLQARILFVLQETKDLLGEYPDTLFEIVLYKDRRFLFSLSKCLRFGDILREVFCQL